MSYRNLLSVTFTASLATVFGCSERGSFEARGDRYGRLEVRVAPESTPAPTEHERGQLRLRGIDVDVQRRVPLRSGVEATLSIVLPAGAYDISFEPDATPEGDDASAALAATPLAAAEAGLPRVVVVSSAQPTQLLVHTRTREEADDAATHALDAAALAHR